MQSLDRLAQRDPSLRFRSDADLGVVRHLRGKLGNGDRDPKKAGMAFISEFPDLFGDVDTGSLAVLKADKDDSGATVVYEQRHASHRVIGGSVRFHVAPDGSLDTVANNLFPDLAKVPKKAKTTAADAVGALQTDAKTTAEPLAGPELVVVRHEGRPYLAWEVRLEDDPRQRGAWGEPTQWVGYVDAQGGAVLFKFNNSQTAGPVVANGTGYYSGAGTVNAWFTDTTYQLRDTTRTPAGPEIRTNDEDGASPSEDVDSNWNDTTTSPRDAHQGPEIDAHRFTGTVVDYFRNVHGRNGYDGAGATLNILTHWGSNVNNGRWNPGTMRVELGDGSGAAPGDDFECTDDWLAHEWTHAYTQFTCGLQYLNESGALNEAFSDVFAAFITGDWMVFEDSWLKASAPASRNMIDPTNGGQWNSADPIGSVLAGHQPSHYSVRYTGASDNGGVHINSGIINNLFYLLTVGGTHTVSNIAVSGIGQPGAEQMLWRCMTVNLVGNPTATFLQFREAMLDACQDLFPGDLFKLSQVKNAFNAVGVGPDVYVRDNLADTGAEPYAGGYLWASPDIINRTSMSANPTADFADMNNDALWQNVEYGQPNYVYVRVQNRGPQNGDATINVYFSAATTFGTPASWIHIGTLTATAIVPGTTRVVGPLTFPQALIPGQGHYCMIAVVSSSQDPAPDINQINSVQAYLDYVAGTNNIAYRNMDVVDDVMPGQLEVVVRGLGDVVEGFELELDDSRFVPGARILVRGPAKALLRAAPLGMKLVGRKEDEVIFELLDGRLRKRHLNFAGHLVRAGKRHPGFQRLRIDDEFTLRIEYELPDERLLKELERPVFRKQHTLAVRQLWNGRPVGGAGLRLHPLKR